MRGKRLASLVELAVIEHCDQVAEGITEEYKHLEFGGHRTSTIAQEFLEAFQSAIWTKAIDEKPERSQQEVAKAETIQDINSQLGESSNCSLVEGAHQSHLCTGGVAKSVDAGCCCNRLCCGSHRAFGLFNRLLHKLGSKSSLLGSWTRRWRRQGREFSSLLSQLLGHQGQTVRSPESSKLGLNLTHACLQMAVKRNREPS